RSLRGVAIYSLSLPGPRPPPPTLVPYPTLFRSGPQAHLPLASPEGVAEHPRGRAFGRHQEVQASPVRVVACTRRRHLAGGQAIRSEEHTSELQSRENLVCRLLLDKKNTHLRDAR